MEDIAARLDRIRKRISTACARAGRSRESVTLIGVTKTVDVSRIRSGIEAGIKHIGENYVQEARSKFEELKDKNITWHFIGHLQSNKARHAVKIFDWIHTVDRISLAKKLDDSARKERQHPLPVLIQVNIGEESTKSGIHPEKLFELYRELQAFDGITVKGLMTIPPYCEDPENVRFYFKKLADLLNKLRDQSKKPELLTELSMGMSHDFEVAIEEGATMIRIGTAIFGPRL